ncbi:phage portal protein [Amycolatopsis anabasis]|uniref:phage portal protein n=1 Tax=Amycolatopsis anabasis TaxID=1840409 RepID=UPI00131B7D9F|nr:phage portal protein [Amycolatopsis anabasis]
MPFVISQGVLASVHQYQTATIPLGGSVTLADGLAQDYATIWKTQPQVRTVVSFLARNIAQLGIHVYRRMSDVDRVRISDHPVAALLARPNGFTTRYRLIEALVSDLAIYDNALLAKANLGSPGLVRLDPRFVTPISANQFTVETYRYRGTTGHRDIPAEQIVHFRGYNPTDNRWGCSPMETLRRTLSEEYQASQYREQLWRNGARLMGYLKRPLDAPEWGEPARERFRRSWQAQYTGTGGKAGGTPILEDGMDFVPASVTPEAAQYIEARKLTREEVASAYHIPLPMVGILDHATYSNIQEQHRNLYQDTLGPWLTMITEELQLQLLPDFEDSQDIYLEFNLGEKLRGSFEEQAVQLQTATGAPWMTRNEARARVNLPQVDGGDELVTPLNVLIGGQASPTDTAPEPKATRDRTLKLLEGLA